MCDLHDRLRSQGPDQMPAVYAHVPPVLHRLVARPISDMSLVHGARRCRPTLSIRERIAESTSIHRITPTTAQLKTEILYKKNNHTHYKYLLK